MEFKLVYQNSFHCVLLLHVSNHKVTSPRRTQNIKIIFIKSIIIRRLFVNNKGTVNVV